MPNLTDLDIIYNILYICIYYAYNISMCVCLCVAKEPQMRHIA